MSAMRVWLVILCFAGATPVAVAASFDCAAAVGSVERMICGDAGLSASDGALGVAFGLAIAASPHPQALRAEQREWVAKARDTAADAVAMTDLYAMRITRLRAQTTAWRAVSAEIVAAPQGACVALAGPVDASCEVTEAGTLAGAQGGALRWWVQRWRDDGVTQTGVVVCTGARTDARAVTWVAEDGAVYAAPRLIASGREMLLDLPGSYDGTGNLSAETLFVWRDGSWREVDITSWGAQMAARLPKGLAVWKGVYPDWARMTAQTPLWRQSDGNCCPKGGSARASLRLDGERVLLDRLRVSTKLVE